MNTKYDWSQVPAEVQWIATSPDSCAYGYSKAPQNILFGRELADWLSAGSLICCVYSNFGGSSDNPFEGEWRKSLEQRPSLGGDL